MNEGGPSQAGASSEELLARSRDVLSDRRLSDLLDKTSRTFAVSIPLLDEPTQRRVGLAYLLLRIADNFEDAAAWSVEDRVHALLDFKSALAPGADPVSAERIADWIARRPQESTGYMELLEYVPAVIDASRACGDQAWAIVTYHVGRSIDGMVETVKRSDAEGGLELQSLEDLKHYCYLVAGIVGEMLTELFVLAAPVLESVRADLDARAVAFGEGLQLVNILKDAAGDAIEGRQFLPSNLDLADVFALARNDLIKAQEYVEFMRHDGTPPGHLAFTALPVRLAWATLMKVEQSGAGAKVSRLAVARHVRAVRVAVKKNRPLFESVGNPA